jgi:hypothetical protein
MTPTEFAAKWRDVTTGERASAQSHFGDLCRMLGEPTPTDADPTGSWYAFEKGAEKFDGRDRFADVWKKGFFAWEYKGKRTDLRAAYRQLVDYKDALENPPLLVVSDLDSDPGPHELHRVAGPRRHASQVHLGHCPNPSSEPNIRASSLIEGGHRGCTAAGAG